MENATVFYRTCVKKLLTEFANFKTDWSDVKLSFDDERGCYVALRVGWFQKYTRIHRCLAHIEVQNDMIVIQANNTEDLIDAALIEMGVPKERIQFGFIPDDFQRAVDLYAPQTSAAIA